MKTEVKSRKTFYFLFNLFYWSIGDFVLCCLVLFSKMIQLYMSYTLFFVSFSIMIYHRILNAVPCATQ